MFSASVIFFVKAFLIQYALSQRVNVNGPKIMNKGVQYGLNNGLQQGPHHIPLKGPKQLGAVINGPSMGPILLNQAHRSYSPSMPNSQVFAGMQKQIFNNAGMQSQLYNGAGIPNPVYGGAGNGKVDVNGELPVSGMTSVIGNVPLTGKVEFNGNVPCNGVVTISGSCASCGLNAPSYGQMPVYGNKHYGY